MGLVIGSTVTCRSLFTPDTEHASHDGVLISESQRTITSNATASCGIELPKLIPQAINLIQDKIVPVTKVESPSPPRL